MITQHEQSCRQLIYRVAASDHYTVGEVYELVRMSMTLRTFSRLLEQLLSMDVVYTVDCKLVCRPALNVLA